MSSISPLIAFTGTTPNIGTTLAAFASAVRIAETSGQPVAYLCLNLKSSKLHRYLRVEKPAVTLDRLRPELQARSLSPEKLKLAAFRSQAFPRVHILFGNMLRDQAEFFGPEEMEHLLDTARQAFGMTVADLSAYWDNAATVTALRRADSRIAVTTPALSHFQEDGRHWLGQSSPLFGVPAEAYDLVIVQPPWRNGGFSMKDVQKETGLSPLGDLRLTEPLFAHLDSGRLDEWLTRDEAGKQAMASAAERLMSRHGVRFGRPAAVQPWYRKLLAHRNGVGL
ncbi:hypothetical protein BG53_12700 [Paenibacillus darwinianus]|uniref:Uncharacterized protein n=1 Tax=Paenibacillus darwinianus TaxID=1380763 RepID=A0A9W5S2Z2_9BACL|nr:hypothetical protein [Paenibacillus darwinianus]EXX86070.1 hypothetical protein CH50_07980 [Paenibacillus darwinianus]EXX86371.1 hypothetical protein BG52_06620 [Paenibacillus darwinianus]EXX90874.1 hypothetical protein BG53_12700 [Paenibacillus darwinianus]